MRASLLANATASLFLCNRSDAVWSHAPKLYRAQLCGRIFTATVRIGLTEVDRVVLRVLIASLQFLSELERCYVADHDIDH